MSKTRLRVSFRETSAGYALRQGVTVVTNVSRLAAHTTANAGEQLRGRVEGWSARGSGEGGSDVREEGRGGLDVAGWEGGGGGEGGGWVGEVCTNPTRKSWAQFAALPRTRSLPTWTWVSDEPQY